MLAAYAGIYLVLLDVDEWGWGVPDAGFTVDAIPIYFQLDEFGKPTGKWIDGAAWQEDTYTSIAETMGPWFVKP